MDRVWIECAFSYRQTSATTARTTARTVVIYIFVLVRIILVFLIEYNLHLMAISHVLGLWHTLLTA